MRKGNHRLRTEAALTVRGNAGIITAAGCADFPTPNEAQSAGSRWQSKGVDLADMTSTHGRGYHVRSSFRRRSSIVLTSVPGTAIRVRGDPWYV